MSATLLIDGAWVGAADGATLPVEDPSTGEMFATLSAGGPGEIAAAVAAARRAADGAWGNLTATERGRLLMRWRDLVLAEAEPLARTESRDVGKPLGQARRDVQALARYLEFYAGAADKLHGEQIPFQTGYSVWTVRGPFGVTGHIIPWNYPLQIFGRSVVGALAAGNACALKPAEEASLSCLAVARLGVAAGLPPGALNLVTGPGETAGAALAAHPGIDHLSFTGSVATGALVQAAAARNAVPVTLELGGKSPLLIFADADHARAVPVAITAGIQNAGQTCSAASRLLVEASAWDDIVPALAARYRALQAGPADADLALGPVITARAKAGIEGWLARAEADGIPVLAKGTVIAQAPPGGHYVAPTLLGPVAPDHPLAQEEIFGPVQVVIPFQDEAESVRIANGTRFGLVAGAFTADFGRALRLGRALRAGQVFLNDYGAAGGVELPFGGRGLSGHGREKGLEGLRGFTTTKTIAAWHG